jgi:hypothetical protein
MIKEAAKRLKDDPWHKKLRRWFKFKRWLWMCRTRMIINYFKQQEQ